MAESKSKAEATIEMKDSMQSKIPLNINSLLKISPSQTVQSYQPTPKTHLEVARQMYPLTNVEAYKLMRIISVKDLSMVWLGIDPRKEYFEVGRFSGYSYHNKIKIMFLDDIEICQKIIIGAIKSREIPFEPKLFKEEPNCNTEVNPAHFVKWWREAGRPHHQLNKELEDHWGKPLVEPIVLPQHVRYEIYLFKVHHKEIKDAEITREQLIEKIWSSGNKSDKKISNGDCRAFQFEGEEIFLTNHRLGQIVTNLYDN